MISLLQRISVPSDSSPELQNLCVQFNNHLNELELQLASLKGSDGQAASISSDIDMQGKRLINAGEPQRVNDSLSINTLRRAGVYKNSIQRNLTRNLKVSTVSPALVDAVSRSTVQSMIAQSSGLTASSVWPIGSVFVSIVSTNPGTLLGFGTWAQIAQGKYLAGYSSGDPDFGTVEGTGGNKNHTHAVDPASTTSGAPSATETVDDTGGGATVSVASATHTHDTDIASTTSGNNSTLPPFFVVYFWKRTA